MCSEKLFLYELKQNLVNAVILLCRYSMISPLSVYLSVCLSRTHLFKQLDSSNCYMRVWKCKGGGKRGKREEERLT